MCECGERCMWGLCILCVILCESIYIYIYICAWGYASVHSVIYIYIYIHTHTHMHIYIYICVCVCVCVNMLCVLCALCPPHIHTYTHTHTHTHIYIYIYIYINPRWYSKRYYKYSSELRIIKEYSILHKASELKYRHQIYFSVILDTLLVVGRCLILLQRIRSAYYLLSRPGSQLGCFTLN